ncbi:sialidase family protein [Priestia endophytica]|uniref:Predicted neuraminidase (Sialidase) n=1 Tax=Priestia endophytica DSM 13796 TaxID=1121089 RepID=A0A1I6B3W3_9BACI|nr:sialidase family protein [Priestia endophytica]KYG26810.1 glycosyl hydrolase [Priestia endophytica]SFQ75630.1 Predicted neuraminidase (sialidase) [Priestia endophytica DSM 13796]
MSNQTAIISDGKLKEVTEGLKRTEAYLPSDCIQNHAANLLVLDNGDLLCTWFAGTQEGIPDIHIYMSRLKKGESSWSKAVKVSDDPTRSEQNPVLFKAPDEKVWLLYTAQKSGNQDTAIVRYRISEDNGHSFGPIKTLFDQEGTFIRQPIVVLDNGEWLLPVFYCHTTKGRKWTGHRDTSAVKISKDEGNTWEEYEVPNSTGCVHMNIEKLDDGTLLALFRSRWADYIYSSYSTDNGKTWSDPKPTELPNNNSSIQFTKLANGHLALVFNKMNAENCTERRASLYDDIEDEENEENVVAEAVEDSGEREAFWGAPRAPMTVAISEDNGVSWPFVKDIEIGDGYAMTNNSKDKLNREYSYPSIKQGSDGNLHIAFTYFRQTIKYVQLTEEEIKR